MELAISEFDKRLIDRVVASGILDPLYLMYEDYNGCESLLEYCQNKHNIDLAALYNTEVLEYPDSYEVEVEPLRTESPSFDCNYINNRKEREVETTVYGKELALTSHNTVYRSKCKELEFIPPDVLQIKGGTWCYNPDLPMEWQVARPSQVKSYLNDYDMAMEVKKRMEIKYSSQPVEYFEEMEEEEFYDEDSYECEFEEEEYESSVDEGSNQENDDLCQVLNGIRTARVKDELKKRYSELKKRRTVENVREKSRQRRADERRFTRARKFVFSRDARDQVLHILNPSQIRTVKRSNDFIIQGRSHDVERELIKLFIDKGWKIRILEKPLARKNLVDVAPDTFDPAGGPSGIT